MSRFLRSTRPRIAVIGAGAVGLSTAVQIQEALPDAVVSVIAEKFNRDTTSDGAAGIFLPSLNAAEGVSKDLMARWTIDSFDYFKQLMASPDGPEAGISHLIGYAFSVDDVHKPDPLIEKIYFDFRPCNEKELSLFPDLAKRASFAYTVSTLMIEGRWLLPYLLKKFQRGGGIVEQRRIENLEELVGHYDIVVNCAGLGSNKLIGDSGVRPVRGQVIRVKAPWLKNFLFVDGYQCYVIPGKETCIIGGTSQYDDSDLTVRKDETERMWRDACKHVPSLTDAEWAWQWVGLRPFRKSLRLERETKTLRRGKLEMVHNYGHGGNGIALSWGTGRHATRLVVEAVAERFGRSKL